MADPAVPSQPSGGERPWAGEALRLLPNLVRLLSRLMRDPRVPRRSKTFALVVLGYLASPIDLLPDFIPVLGQADDLLLVVLALQHLVNDVGEEIVLEHWEGSEDVLAMVRGVLDWGAHRVPWPLRRAVRRYVSGS